MGGEGRSKYFHVSEMDTKLFGVFGFICVSLFYAVRGEANDTNITNKYYDDLVKALPPRKGKCVAITGTTSGIGYWTALATVKKGPSCLIMLNRNPSRAVQAQSDMEKAAAVGVNVTTVLIDL